MIVRRRGPGLIRTAARTAVIAGTATAVSGSVARHQQERAMEAAQAASPAPAAAPVDMSAQMAQIEQLGQLKSQGLLTEEEFNAKKQQILGL